MTDNKEQKIQEEIIKRVLDKYELLQEEKEKIQDTDATIEALEEITKIPKKELNRIVKEVRSSYLKEKNEEKQKRKKILLIIIIISSLFAIIFTIRSVITSYQEKKAEMIQKIDYRVVFTSGIKNARPIDSFNEVLITKKRVYFFVRLLNLEPGKEYYYACKTYDCSGTLLLETTPDPFTPTSNTFHHWCWYSFDPITDAPGIWRFEAFIDGVKLVEEKLKVLPRPDNNN